MKKTLTKTLAFLLTLVLMVGSLSILPVDAATIDLKKANIQWDLKNNKTVKYRTKWAVLGVKKHNLTMKNYKVKKLSNGKKMCTFTLVFKSNISPSNRQIYNMLNYYQKNDHFGGFKYFAVVDYKTGKNLENKNNVGVTVSSSWDFPEEKTYTSTDDYYITVPTKSVCSVKIIYPANYKNLTVVAGGHPTISQSEISKFFAENSTYTFSKANGILYSKSKNLFAHAIRIK